MLDVFISILRLMGQCFCVFLSVPGICIVFCLEFV
jgi:hypothetical protein